MRTSTWISYVIVGLAALCHIGFSTPIVKRQALYSPQSIDPAHQSNFQDLEMNEDTDRDKRKIEGAVEVKYGFKNAILGLIFNPWKHKLFRHKRAIDNNSNNNMKVTPSKIPTTTEDIVLFTPGEKVSLDVPAELFGSGFSLVTNVSQIIGSLIQNSADRTAQVFESMKPFLQSVFGVKSITITRDGPGANMV